MKIAGIDPGLTGAAALLIESGGSISEMRCVDIPTTGCRADKDVEIDFRAFRDLLRDWKPDYLYLENVHAFIQQGVVAAGRFMKAAGALEAIAACEVDNCVLVTPKKWTARFNLHHTDKTANRELVMKLLPKYADLFMLKKSHNKADAALIGLYGCDRCDIIELPRYG